VKRILLAVLPLVLAALPALAQEYAPPPMNDPLALRLICASRQEWTNKGPSYSRATIFSVPEPGGRGERLYVGFVGDAWYSRTGHALWRGPVATCWEGLRRAPGYNPNYSAINPARYRLDRLSARPGGGMDNASMEIVLDASPPQLRHLDAKSGVVLESRPLGERIPMTEALKLVTRLRQEVRADTPALRLRGYAVDLGQENPRKDRRKVKQWLDGPKWPYLIAVCGVGDPARSELGFLPPRHYGWRFEKLLGAPAPDDAEGVFTLLLLSEYWGRGVDGDEHELGRRSQVRIGLRGMEEKVVQSDLCYSVDADDWRPCLPAAAPRP